MSPSPASCLWLHESEDTTSICADISPDVMEISHSTNPNFLYLYSVKLLSLLCESSTRSQAAIHSLSHGRVWGCCSVSSTVPTLTPSPHHLLGLPSVATSPRLQATYLTSPSLCLLPIDEDNGEPTYMRMWIEIKGRLYLTQP